MNPKKTLQHAAQSITVSCSATLGSQHVLIACSRGGVRGSRGHDGVLGARFMPLATYCKRAEPLVQRGHHGQP